MPRGVRHARLRRRPPRCRGRRCDAPPAAPAMDGRETEEPMHRKAVVVVGCLLAAGCGGTIDSGSEPSAAGPGAPASDVQPTGRGGGVASAPGFPEEKPATRTTNGISYHGGPLILGTVNVYYVWYG